MKAVKSKSLCKKVIRYYIFYAPSNIIFCPEEVQACEPKPQLAIGHLLQTTKTTTLQHCHPNTILSEYGTQFTSLAYTRWLHLWSPTIRKCKFTVLLEQISQATKQDHEQYTIHL